MPGCAIAVIVPTSTWPNPRLPRPRTAKPSLSNPAATPNGDGNVRPERLDGERRVGPGEALDESAEPERREGADEAEREVVRGFGVHAGQEDGEEKSIHAGTQAIGAVGALASRSLDGRAGIRPCS